MRFNFFKYNQSERERVDIGSDFAMPLFVEFIGVPGVGKSTLCSALLERNREWMIGAQDVLLDVSLTGKYTAEMNDEFYQGIAQHKLSVISKSDYQACDKLELLGYFGQIIQLDRKMSLYRGKKIVVADEGLFHNFSSSVEFVYENSRAVPNNLGRRVLIHCYSSPERISCQILKREKETGRLLPQHKNKTIRELEEHQKEALLMKEKFTQFVQKVLGTPVLSLNTSDPQEENLNKINNFIEELCKNDDASDSGLKYLSKHDFHRLTKLHEGGHWTADTFVGRWDYHSRVISLIKALKLQDPSKVLEMGTMGVSCVKNGHTIDYSERWDFKGKRPTYLHDARILPWPIKDKEYDLFVALRVYQHLVPRQEECVKEAMRISKKVILVVPGEYNNSVLPKSKGITYKKFVECLDGVHPNIYKVTEFGDLFYWNTEEPSFLDVEHVCGSLDAGL